MDSIFGWMANAAIDASGGSAKVFGTKPGVAEFLETDAITEAGKAARGNLANMPDIMAFLESVLPGYKEMLSTGSKSTLSLLRGELPKDVQSAVQRNSAFKSLMNGFAGSGMSRALEARDIGRTSLDMMNLGQNSAMKWAGLAQAGVSPFITTAPAQTENTWRNSLYKQATEQHKMNVLAAPDPGAAGLFNIRTALGMQALSFGMGSIAGAGGGAPANTGGASSGAMSAGAASIPWGTYTGG